MAAFINLFIIIMFVIVIVSNVKKQNEKKDGRQNAQGVYGNTPPNYQRHSQAVGNHREQKKPLPPKPVKDVGNVGKEKSTTEYLSEKAKQDQREHELEKMQERKRVEQKYGNRPVGGRYLAGDPVPAGMKIICCQYCGAENAVKIDYRGDRNCYFCRTRLEE